MNISKHVIIAYIQDYEIHMETEYMMCAPIISKSIKDLLLL